MNKNSSGCFAGRSFFHWLVFLVFLSTCSAAMAQSIFTIVGGGTDDGLAATAAALNEPRGVAVDKLGRLYIAEARGRIRFVSGSGLISTVAGVLAAGFGGDGGPATKARLFSPRDVVIDNGGNLLIADLGNQAVRKVDLVTGVITTIAGRGTSTRDGIPATDAMLTNPHSLAIDGVGNVYVAERSAVRQISSSGLIKTIVQFPVNGVNGIAIDPTTDSFGIAVDTSGNTLYFADVIASIWKIDLVRGGITRYAGTGTAGFGGDNGQATLASLSRPQKLALNSSGDLFISDFGNGRIRKVDSRTNNITTSLTIGDPTLLLGWPGDEEGPGLTFDGSDNLYAIDNATNSILKVTATGSSARVAGNGEGAFVGDGNVGTAAGLSYPASIAQDRNGNIYIADALQNRIRKWSPSTSIVSTVAGTGRHGFSGDEGQAIAAQLSFPDGVACDSAGNNLYIADMNNYVVRKVNLTSGVITTVAGNHSPGDSGDNGPATAASFGMPSAVALDASGSLYILDHASKRVRRLTNGFITSFAGGGTSSADHVPPTAASLQSPTGIAVDLSGNVYIADVSRIRMVDAQDREISTVAGNGITGFSGDNGLALSAMIDSFGVTVDAARNVFISSAQSQFDQFSAYSSHRIRRVNAAGIITTVAGSGPVTLSFSLPGGSFEGDGGPAGSARLNNPHSVIVDVNGNLYIADTYNGRIRTVMACQAVGLPTLLMPTDGAPAVSTAPTLSWSAIDHAFHYDILLDTQSPPQTRVASDLVSTTLTFTPSNLNPGTRYYWQIVAKGDPFCAPQSTASEIRSFTTLAACTAPGGFDLAQPANGASGVASSAQLSWQTAGGASSYDLYFGPSNPPALFTKGVSATTQNVSGLTASTTYYWYVVAHATCDSTKTTASPQRSFQTAGGCSGAGPFSLNSPSNGATGVSLTARLDWSASSNASSYDVYLGTSSPPPLYLPDVATLPDLATPRIGVSGLEPSRTYSWRVVAKVACDQSKNFPSSTSTFTTAGVSTTPGATSITFVPPGNVAVGQTYTVAWQELPELGTDGCYLVERSTSSSFATILDSQQSFSTSASFISSTAGTYYHRVSAVPGCDLSHPGPVSQVKSVNIVIGTANVIFTVQPQAVITAVGDKLEDQKARFTLENLGSSALPVLVSAFQDPAYTFFSWRDPLGGNSGRFTLDSRIPKSFDIEFHGPPNGVSGVYQGFIVVNAEGQALAITPSVFVSLKVGGGATSRPVFLTNGTPTEYAFFPGFAGNEDVNRPPITVSIRNDGTAPMELGAEIGPEVWLVPEKDWNATPIPPGLSRSIRLTTHRYSAPNGSALPRYTYFTVRSKNGETARLLVQDNDALPTSFGRTSLLDPGSRSFIVPGVVSAPPQFSRVRLTNVGSDPVQTDLFFTPAGSDGLNAAAVKRATIVVPPNDVVTLTDPLMQVFGLIAPAQGQIEVRAAPSKIGFLVVSSSVLTPVTTGGNYSYEMPTLLLGEGARLGTSHVIVGVASNSRTQTALTLVETSGTEPTRVRAILFDAQGARKGDRLVDVARYGQTRIDNVVTALGGSEPLDHGRIELDVESGGGSVAGVVTMLDATRNNGASLVSQPTGGTVSGSAVARLRQAKIGTTGVSATAVVPVVVNGPSPTGASQRTTMGFTVTTGSPKTAAVTYRPSDPAAPPINKTLQLPSGVTLYFDNVLEDLFGIPKGQTAGGSVFIQAGIGAQIYARLATLIGTTWTVSSGLPIVPTLSDVLTSLSSKHPLYLDGLEQSIDATRGTRWSVNINEIAGASGSVLVRLYEAGNRSVAIAEKRYNIAAYQQLKLDTVFAALGLDSDDRRKDRTNVLCAVSADGGNALVSAVGEAIDNRTGDTRHFVFSPTGGVPSTGVLRITIATPVPPPSSGRRRAVRH